MEVNYINSHCGTHNFEIKKDDFEAKVKIADHDGMQYVRQILPSRNGEHLRSFDFKSKIENEIVSIYKKQYQEKLN